MRILVIGVGGSLLAISLSAAIAQANATGGTLALASETDTDQEKPQIALQIRPLAPVLAFDPRDLPAIVPDNRTYATHLWSDHRWSRSLQRRGRVSDRAYTNHLRRPRDGVRVNHKTRQS